MLASRLQQVLLATLIALLGAIAVVLMDGAGTGHGSGTSSAHPDGLFDGPTLPPGLTAANFTLTDQHGQLISLDRYRGRVVVLTFIHSKCKDACPLMVQDIKGALDLLGPAARGVTAIGVSVEPSQDTAASRRTFLAGLQMDSRLHFVSGSLPLLRRVWHAYAIQPVEGPIDHSAFVLLIDRQGRERVGWPVIGLTPEGLAHDLTVLERRA